MKRVKRDRSRVHQVPPVNAAASLRSTTVSERRNDTRGSTLCRDRSRFRLGREARDTSYRLYAADLPTLGPSDDRAPGVRARARADHCGPRFSLTPSIARRGSRKTVGRPKFGLNRLSVARLSSAGRRDAVDLPHRAPPEPHRDDADRRCVIQNLATPRAAPVSSRMCMPVFARSTM